MTKRCALIQMNSRDDVATNLRQAEGLIALAARGGAEAVFLPEYFYFMGSYERTLLLAEDLQQGPIQQRIQEWCRSFRLWVFAGSTPIRLPSGKMASATLVFDSKGELRSRYDKMHLFDQTVELDGQHEQHRESDFVAPGGASQICDWDGAQVGLSICYDLRFPELYRQMSARGAEVLSVPAAFLRATGVSHWHALLKARAIENLAYVIAANQVGEHPDGKATFGESVVYDPWGEVVAQAKTAHPETVLFNLDLARVTKLRESFSVLKHRRILS